MKVTNAKLVCVMYVVFPSRRLHWRLHTVNKCIRIQNSAMGSSEGVEMRTALAASQITPFLVCRRLITQISYVQQMSCVFSLRVQALSLAFMPSFLPLQVASFSGRGKHRRSGVRRCRARHSGPSCSRLLSTVQVPHLSALMVLGGAFSPSSAAWPLLPPSVGTALRAFLLWESPANVPLS